MIIQTENQVRSIKINLNIQCSDNSILKTEAPSHSVTMPIKKIQSQMASGSRQTRQNNTSTVHMNARRIRNERDERSVSTAKFIEYTYMYVLIPCTLHKEYNTLHSVYRISNDVCM